MIKKLRQFERKGVADHNWNCRLANLKTGMEIEFSPVDISKLGLGAIIQVLQSPGERFELFRTRGDGVELTLVWIDYDSHEQRFRCGFKVVDESIDLERFALALG